MIEILPITARETFVVRHPVLRKGRPMEDCKFSGDELGTTFHLGAFEKDKIIGVTTLVMNKEVQLEQLKNHKLHHCYQMRGMAVLEVAQNKGIGKKLLKKSEEILKKRDIEVLWFNARITAVPFYEKMGYKIVGDLFDIPTVGDHYKMLKVL